MNRRERRKMSHKLGILQYQQKLLNDKKFNLIRENIIAGKKREAQVKEDIRQQTNKIIEEKESQIIYHIAEDIVKRKNISMPEALDEAKKIYLETY